jgi:phosphoribosylglycinamide formyltransferase-1
VTKRVGIIISGGGSNMIALVNEMQRSKMAVPSVVLSNSPDALGLKKAHDLGVTTAVVDHRSYGKDRGAFENALHTELVKAQVDVVCLAGFMRILSADFIALWDCKILNIHPSLLPDYKGLNTHARVLSSGDQYHGCSVHLVTAALDDGPILGQAKLTVAKEDTAQSLAARVLPLEHQLYPRVLARFLAGDLSRLDLSL